MDLPLIASGFILSIFGLIILNSLLTNYELYRKIRGGKWTLHRMFDTHEPIWIRYSKEDDKSPNTIKIENYEQ